MRTQMHRKNVMRREEGKWGDGGNHSESPENYALRLVHLVIYLKTGSKVLGYGWK